jgi:hypothetical protein
LTEEAKCSKIIVIQVSGSHFPLDLR